MRKQDPKPVDSTAWTGEPDPPQPPGPPADHDLTLRVASRLGLSPGGTPFGRAVFVAAVTIATIALHWVEFKLWPETMEALSSSGGAKGSPLLVLFGAQWCVVAWVLNLYRGLFRRKMG